MKRKIISLWLLCVSFHIYCQDSVKIDSVFKSFFTYLDTDDNKIISRSNDDSICIYYEKLQVIYDFLENITGIYMKRELRNNVIYISCNDSIIKQWEKWYSINQSKLVWIDDGIKIIKPDSKWFKCVDYVNYYPNNIRYNCKRKEIPISDRPQYIKDTNKKSRNDLKPILSPVERRIESKQLGDSL
jgi:hypothetical protein